MRNEKSNHYSRVKYEGKGEIMFQATGERGNSSN
jgi:hypothetical protein